MKIEDYPLPESREDRLALMKRLEESFEADDVAAQLTPAQRAELKARITEFRAGKATLIPGEAVMQEIREKYDL